MQRWVIELDAREPAEQQAVPERLSPRRVIGAAPVAERADCLLDGPPFQGREEIGIVVAESGLVISELSPIARSLEDVFLELTSGEE